MKSKLAVALALSISQLKLASAQSGHRFGKGHTEMRLALPRRIGKNVTVPMLLVSGLPTVHVMINGYGPFLFAIDTGQPFSLSIVPEAAARAALSRTGQAFIGDPSGGDVKQIPTCQVRYLKLVGLTFMAVDPSGAEMRRSGHPEIAGTIGMSLFAGFTLTMDFANSRLHADRGNCRQPMVSTLSMPLWIKWDLSRYR